MNSAVVPSYTEWEGLSKVPLKFLGSCYVVVAF